MNGKDLRVICVGIGEMGKIGVQTLLDHNASIVATVDINESYSEKMSQSVQDIRPAEH